MFCSFTIVRRDRQTEEEVIVDVVQTTDVNSVISYKIMFRYAKNVRLISFFVTSLPNA